MCILLIIISLVSVVLQYRSILVVCILSFLIIKLIEIYIEPNINILIYSYICEVIWLVSPILLG